MLENTTDTGEVGTSTERTCKEHQNLTTAPRERSHANDTGWHLPSGMKSLQKYQWMCGRAWTKRIQAEQRGIGLPGIFCPPDSAERSHVCLRESRRCPPGAGSFSKLGCGAGRCYPWSERDGEPWHSPGWLWVLCTTTSSQVTSSTQDGAAPNPALLGSHR